MHDDWKNAFGILKSAGIRDGAGAGIHRLALGFYCYYHNYFTSVYTK